MKNVKGMTGRIAAMLLSGILMIGSVPIAALGTEIEVDTEEVTEAVVEDSGEEIVESYTVTLDANGGYFTNEWDDSLNETLETAETVTKLIPVGGSVETLPVMKQEDADVTFSGWSLEKDGELVSQGDEEYTPVDNCVLYAVWKTSESVESSSNEESIEYISDTPENDISLRVEGEEEAVDRNEQKQVTTTDITPVIRNAESDTSKTSNDKNSLDAEWLNDIDPIQSTGYYYRNTEMIEKIEDPQYSHAIEFDASYDTSAVYDLNKMYDTFSGTVCTGKTTGSGVFTVSIYCDGVLTHKISDVTKKNNYISFSLDVSDVSELEIRSHNSGSWGNGWVYLADGLLTYKSSLSGIQLFESKDFIGVWEGEYDGFHGDDVIRRHFVLTIDECTVESGNIAKISGYNTFSQSIENPSEYYLDGSDKIEGRVNLKTGAMFFQGIEWIQYPVGGISYSNCYHPIYNGYMSPDKQSISGIVQNEKSRTYYAKKVENISSTTIDYLEVGIGGDVNVHWKTPEDVSSIKGYKIRHRIVGTTEWRTTTVSGGSSTSI